MADKIKTEVYLNIDCGFEDGDTRTIVLKNPRSDISVSEIKSLETFIKQENIIIGDRDSSNFRKIRKAVKRNTTTTYLDLD